MKSTLTLAAAVLLASVSFAVAADSQQGQPPEEGQKAERNMSGTTGGSQKNPSPTMMQKGVRGPADHQPFESGQKAERNPSGKTGGTETNPSPRATTGASPRGPKSNMPAEANQEAERNPSGKTGGSSTNPSSK
jgi:hypothetical protein